MSDNLEERLRTIVVEQLGVTPEKVTRETYFADLGMDSLDDVELIMAFEEETGLTIPEEDAKKLVTFGKVLDYLRKHGG